MDAIEELIDVIASSEPAKKPPRKPPRKPRPSEVAAKLAKEAAKKPAVKKTKPKKVVKKKAKRAPNADAGMRSERLDMRLTKAEKKMVTALAKKKQQTVTSIMIEALGKIR